jgi:lipopolysaccharide/colanic/teichoic acid biosynthesis glycosyltransferase
VLAKALFRDALLRERRRSDRFHQPFVLVLVTLNAGPAVETKAWVSVIEALTAAKRDTDVLGWFERGAVLGLIAPEIESSETSFVREIESRVNLAVATRLDIEARADFSIRLHRHTGSSPSAQKDPVVEPLPRDVHMSARTKVRDTLKRLLDLTAGTALLLLVSPLFLLIALLVKWKSPGPVFFRQVRIGEHGTPFTMLKFRTMHVHADSAIHKEFVSQMIKGTTPSGSDTNQEAPFKIANDPRVTSFGRLLRRTSLDELPQLWNVIRGDMSLVGPRPPLTYEVEQYQPWHYRRVLEAKPGVTGLWQVSGRSRTTFDEMVRLDLRYAKQCSAWMDLKILLATPRAVISGKGAR